MTSMQIAAEIDALILRLREARDILATLAPQQITGMEELTQQGHAGETTPVVAASPKPMQATVAEDGAATVKKLRTPRTPRRRPQQPLSTALRGAIPQGPVAVSAADAVRLRPAVESASRPLPAPVAKDAGHSLDDLVRELTRRSDSVAPGPLSPQ